MVARYLKSDARRRTRRRRRRATRRSPSRPPPPRREKTPRARSSPRRSSAAATSAGRTTRCSRPSRAGCCGSGTRSWTLGCPWRDARASSCLEALSRTTLLDSSRERPARLERTVHRRYSRPRCPRPAGSRESLDAIFQPLIAADTGEGCPRAASRAHCESSADTRGARIDGRFVLG